MTKGSESTHLMEADPDSKAPDEVAPQQPVEDPRRTVDGSRNDPSPPPALERPCRTPQRESRRARSRRRPMRMRRCDIAHHRDDRRQQTHEGPIGFHATDVGGEEDRHDRGRSSGGHGADALSPLPPDARRVGSCWDVRQAKAPDQGRGVARRQGRRDHVPADSDDAQRAGDGDGPQGGASPQHEEENRHRDIAGDGQRDRQRRSAVPTAAQSRRPAARRRSRTTRRAATSTRSRPAPAR